MAVLTGVSHIGLEQMGGSFYNPARWWLRQWAWALRLDALLLLPGEGTLVLLTNKIVNTLHRITASGQFQLN
jgi:hypothetical protein